jgi:hypothetical protein
MSHDPADQTPMTDRFGETMSGVGEQLEPHESRHTSAGGLVVEMVGPGQGPDESVGALHPVQSDRGAQVGVTFGVVLADQDQGWMLQ